MSDKLHRDTRLAHAGCDSDPLYGGVTPPLHLATTFVRDSEYDPDGPAPTTGLPRGFTKGYIYSRLQSPTRAQLEHALAAAEGAYTADPAAGGTSQGFSACASFSSGQAAVMSVLMAGGPKTHLVLGDDVYHGVRTLVKDVMSEWGLQYSECDASNIEQVRASVAKPLDEGYDVLLWVESPSNPLLKVCDISGIAQVVRQEQQRVSTHSVKLCVDATWMTPCICRPLEHGADIVMHSLTKYAGGHSDLLGGAIIVNIDTCEQLMSRIRSVQLLGGAGLAPMDCWLCLRGLRSMAVRVKAQCDTAHQLARFLESSSDVHTVYYPGLQSHPQHALAARQMAGSFGGMLSFEMATAAAARAVCSRVALFKRATSLGGTESLIEHRRDVEGPYSSTPVGLIRVSVGLENVQDLIDDLKQAFQHARENSKL